MARPLGATNKSKYIQGDLPKEMLPTSQDEIAWNDTVETCSDEDKCAKVVEFADLKNYQLQGEKVKMLEIKQVIRTIARSNVTTYDKDGALKAVSMFETEMYLNQLLASGWQLYYIQMLSQNEVTFDMLYVFTK